MLKLDGMLLEIETKRIAPDITVLEFAGKIALGRESKRVETLVQDLLRQNEKKIIFDISRVDHMDSTGIGVMAYCFGTLNRCGGQLRLAGACGKVLHLFQITHLDNILPLYPSVEAARQSLGDETLPHETSGHPTSPNKPQ
jgi:anti-sigma B factor antagonist